MNREGAKEKKEEDRQMFQVKTILGNQKKLFLLFLRALCVFAVRLKDIFVKL